MCRVHPRSCDWVEIPDGIAAAQACEQATGELAHLHWFTYTEDPAGVPGRYGDGALVRITHSQMLSKLMCSTRTSASSSSS